MSEKPLVSVLIPNYNYGIYLPTCFDSVLSQRYRNIEVIFCDNNSSDNSYDIALEYKEKFIQKGINILILRNEKNIGSHGNSLRCNSNAKGEYIIYLSSDDYLDENFIEKCVGIMDENKNIGMTITHRNEVDENGEIYKTPSFYNKSCIIPGRKQVAVYMMAGIAVPSQCLTRKAIFDKVDKNKLYAVAGDWYYNFMVACNSDVAYIKDPLCYYRVHSGNETSESERNLTGIFEHYQLINDFKRIAKEYGIQEAVDRYDKAVEKLGDMCLRYAIKMLKNHEVKIAKKYIQLAPVFNEGIVTNKIYSKLIKIINLNIDEIEEEISKLGDLNRSVSYNPPECSIDLGER